jgi:Ras-related protein Rab-21
MSYSAAVVADGQPISFKVILLGEGAVGKTSMILRFAENQFSDRHVSTLQASCQTKKLNIDGRHVTLTLWDTAGQERFHALGPVYYRNSHGAILVYDITDEHSFQKVKRWVIELRTVLGRDVCLQIAGNKVDCEKDRNVSLRDAESYAASVGARHFQTSAKCNKGIEELFLDLTKAMIAKADEAAARVRQSSSAQSTSGCQKSITIVNDVTTSRVCCSGLEKL